MQFDAIQNLVLKLYTNSYSKKDNHDLSDYYSLEQALVLYSFLEENKISPGLEKSKVFSLLGFYSGKNMRIEQQGAYYKKALKLNIAKEKWEDAYLSYSNIAFYYKNINNFEETTHYLNEGLKLRLEKFKEDYNELANSYYMLSFVYVNKGDFDTAISYIQKSIHLSNKSEKKDYSFQYLCYEGLGFMMGNKGDYKRQLHYFNLQQEIIDKNPKVTKKNDLLNNNLGFCHTKLGNTKLAEKHFILHKNYYLNKYGENNSHVSTAYLTLANFYLIILDTPKALFNLEIARKIGRKLFPAYHAKQISLYKGFAKYYHLLGDLDNEILFFHKAIIANTDTFNNKDVYSYPTISDKCAKKTLLLSTIFNKAEAIFKKYKKTKDPILLEHSYRGYRVAVDFIKVIRKSSISNKAKLQLNKETISIFEKGIESALKLNKKKAAFIFFEESKAQLLLENLKELEAKALSFIPKNYLSREANLKKQIAYLNKKILQLDYRVTAESKSSNKTLSQYHSRLLDTTNSLEKLHLEFESKFPEYHLFRKNQQIAKPEEIQKILISRFPKNDRLIIEYIIGAENIIICVLTNIQYHFITLKKPADLSELIKEFRDAISIGDIEDFAEYSFKLYSLLLQPLENFLAQAKQLIIIPDGMLNYIPFEALLSKKTSIDREFDQLPYLINDYIVSYQYSLNLMLHLFNSETTKNKEPSFFGIAPIDFSKSKEKTKGYQLKSKIDENENIGKRLKSFQLSKGSFSSLSETEKEVSMVFDLFKERNFKALSLFYDEANKKNVLTHIEKYKYILLSTHGFVNKTQADLSGILLSYSNDTNDGQLYSADIYSLNLQADLVVLSSCESGIGQVLKGEGMIALHRSFLYAGASNIVYALFKVPQGPTRDLIFHLFQNILSKEAAYSIALREAKLMLKNQKGAQPLDWAGFALVGIG